MRWEKSDEQALKKCLAEARQINLYPLLEKLIQDKSSEKLKGALELFLTTIEEQPRNKFLRLFNEHIIVEAVIREADAYFKDKRK